MTSATTSLNNLRTFNAVNAAIETFAKDPTTTLLVDTKVARALLIRTNATLVASDGLRYEITSKSIGAGVYRLATKSTVLPYVEGKHTVEVEGWTLYTYQSDKGHVTGCSPDKKQFFALEETLFCVDVCSDELGGVDLAKDRTIPMAVLEAAFRLRNASKLA